MKTFCFRTPGIAILIVMLASSGCMTPPKTTAEFRKMAKDGGMFLSSETYTVKRPYQQVVSTYKQRAQTCLSQSIEKAWKDRYGTHYSTTTWTAMMNATDRHMECTLQMHGDENSHEVYDPPNKYGHYHLLVDAYPVDQNTTRITLSKTIVVSDTVVQATKNWATGTNMGCPDMTQ